MSPTGRTVALIGNHEVAAAELRRNPVAAARAKQQRRATNMALRARAKLDPKLGK